MNKNTSTIRIPKFDNYQLENGLTVYVMPIDKMPLISVKCIIKDGASKTPPGKSGLATIMMEMLKKGAGNRNAFEFSEAVDYLGAGMDTAALQDYSFISADLLADQLDVGLHLFSDMILSPTFPETEFISSKNRLLAAIQGIKDNPSSLNSHLFHQYFYGSDHPYGIPSSGKKQDIESITLQDVKDCYTRSFLPNNAIIIVAGNFNQNTLNGLLQKHFGDWGPGEIYPDQRKMVPRQSENRYIIFNKPEIVQAQIRMAYPGIYQGHPDTYPIILANHIFGGGFTSRLLDEIRVKRGLTYSISSGFTLSFHQGAFAIGTFTKTESTREMIEAILDQLSKFKSSGITQSELSVAVNFLVGLYPLSLETCENLAGKLGAIAFYDLPSNWISQYIPLLQAVTKDDVERSITNHFPLNGLTTVILGNAESILPQIESLGKVEVREISDSDL